MVLGPYLRGRAPGRGRSGPQPNERPPAARLGEAVGLARAIDLEVVQAGLVPAFFCALISKTTMHTLLATLEGSSVD